MENDGVLKPAEVSDLATPIVCVPETDESVRICSGYKGTVSPIIQTEQFPIPTMEVIRGRVSSWKKFTKIDLRSAYLQLVFIEPRYLATFYRAGARRSRRNLCNHGRSTSGRL